MHVYVLFAFQARFSVRSLELSHVRRQHTWIADCWLVFEGNVAGQLGPVVHCSRTHHYRYGAARCAVSNASYVCSVSQAIRLNMSIFFQWFK